MADNPLLKALPDGQFVEIDGDALFLGRDCHLVAFIPTLYNKVVSNRHCAVKKEGPGRWMLEDLGSTNGTWIRGTRLNGKTLIHTGDTFSLGKSGPTFECVRNFGGLGPNATVAEDAASAARHKSADAAAAATMLDPNLAAKTILASNPKPPEKLAKADGSAEHPYRVGATPTIRLRHERTGQEYTVSGYTVLLGRDPAAQIVIRSDEEKHVSGRHAEIQFRSDGTVVVRDLGSRNGTWLNDEKVKEDMPIAVGDRILLGAATTILLIKKIEGV